jgi:teichuronic acid biosynthesis glycosyltransferase TuaH
MIEQKRKILVIPHTSMTNVKVRALELAKSLAQSYDVSYLSWGNRESDRLGAKIRYGISELSGDIETWEERELRLIRVPVVHRPFWLVERHNQKQLRRLLARFSFDLVFSSSSYLFPFPDSINISYIYDLADDHAAGCRESNPRQARFVDGFIEAETKKASRVTVASKALRRLVLEEYGRDSILIPNGVDIKEYTSVHVRQIKELRENLGISERFVIGAIGNHDRWSGLDFLIQAFGLIREDVPGSCLLVVGGGSEVDRLAPNLKDDAGIIFTGPVEPAQMALFFASIDIGVLPFEVNAFTHSALPMKIIEYSAARKTIVSTPLEGVESLDLPNIIFAEPSLDKWVRALREAKQSSWNPRWDQLINKYDWKNISAKLQSEVLAKLSEDK